MNNHDDLPADGIIRREFTAANFRAAETDKGERTVTGIGVPYGQTIELAPGILERFEAGACDDDTNALAYWRHRDPIGRVIESRDTNAGREVTLRLSTTPTADEAYTLVRDDVIRSMSIGFRPLEYRTETDDDGNETTIYTRVDVLEYSLVPFPAYSEASITNVRHKTTTTPDKETPMGDTITRDDFDALTTDLTGRLDDLRREMSTWTGNTDAADAIDQRAAMFGSFGEWVTAVANDGDARHDDAIALHRDITTSDVPSNLVNKPGFIGDLSKKVTERRRWLNRFKTRALPAKGMTVDYIQTLVTATVDEQAKELDELTKAATFSVTPKSAPVRTFGGGNTVSRQVIDRSDAWALTAMFEAYALDYARKTEAATKTYISGLISGILDAAVEGTFLNLAADAGAFDWIDVLVDASGIFEDKGYSLDRLTVSPDVFKTLAKEAGLDGRPLLTTYGQGVNVVGEVNIPAASGNLLRLPVDVLHGTEGLAMFDDPIAIETLESPGAPFWLQEDRALNLARDYACYGYIAHINPHPAAILPVKIAAAGV